VASATQRCNASFDGARTGARNGCKLEIRCAVDDPFDDRVERRFDMETTLFEFGANDRKRPRSNFAAVSVSAGNSLITLPTLHAGRNARDTATQRTRLREILFR
jgi:hypothetical protein